MIYVVDVRRKTPSYLREEKKRRENARGIAGESVSFHLSFKFQKPGKVMKLKLNRAKVMKTDELLDKRRETKREREIKTKEEIRDERKTEREENNGEKKRGFAQRKKPTPK